MMTMKTRMTTKFLSTPSARRATGAAPLWGAASLHFYPRPPRGGRPAKYTASKKVFWISIHALREEGDLPGRAYGLIYNISIHALREEGDQLLS